MGILNSARNKIGILTVQIEGFFTERFINLCKINNIKIWDIRNIVKGVVRFKISIYDFKKLRKVARKTKCKVNIKNKEGMYFILFKYRKRKLALLFVLIAIISSIIFSTFIWQIEIIGNINISNEYLKEKLKESGVYVGKNKIGLDKKQIINEIRTKISDVSWVGVEIKGSKVIVEIVEKTRLAQENVQNTSLGNIIASKSGTITKIIPENGTAVYKSGSFIEQGAIAIEGVLYSKYIEPIKVSAKGMLRANCIYDYQNVYKYSDIKKEYTDKIRYTVGFTINSKEKIVNYLNKNKKYDINKMSKVTKIFGNDISLDVYKFHEYNEIIINYTKDELLERLNKDIDEYLNECILKKTKDGYLVDKDIDIVEFNDGIKVNVKYTVNEEIGEFVAQDPVIRKKYEGEKNE